MAELTGEHTVCSFVDIVRQYAVSFVAIFYSCSILFDFCVDLWTGDGEGGSMEC